MIEDKELRDLFKVESAEHLQALEKGLLRLEKEPGDKATLDEVFREAHSLKGAARMVGVSGVGTISHKIEDILGSAKKGETVLTSDVIDRLYKGLDSMKKLVNEAVTGEAAGVNVSEVLEQIEGKEPSPSPQSSTHPGINPVKGEEEKRRDEQASSLPVEKLPVIPSPQAGEGQGEGNFRIETVRVDTKILDMLMTQAGELMVTKTHISHRLSEIDEIFDKWEELERTSRPSTRANG